MIGHCAARPGRDFSSCYCPCAGPTESPSRVALSTAKVKKVDRCFEFKRVYFENGNVGLNPSMASGNNGHGPELSPSPSPSPSLGGKILKPSVFPPRFIIQLHFRTPFSCETTNKTDFSAYSSAYGAVPERRAENLNYRVTTPACKLQDTTSNGVDYTWPEGQTSNTPSHAAGAATTADRRQVTKTGDLYGLRFNGVMPGTEADERKIERMSAYMASYQAPPSSSPSPGMVGIPPHRYDSRNAYNGTGGNDTWCSREPPPPQQRFEGTSTAQEHYKGLRGEARLATPAGVRTPGLYGGAEHGPTPLLSHTASDARPIHHGLRGGVGGGGEARLGPYSYTDSQTATDWSTTNQSTYVPHKVKTLLKPTPQLIAAPETRDFETSSSSAYKAPPQAPPGPAQATWRRTRVMLPHDACIHDLSQELQRETEISADAQHLVTVLGGVRLDSLSPYTLLSDLQLKTGDELRVWEHGT